MRVTTDNDIRLMLDAQIVEREGGDFLITRLANGRKHLKIWNPVDQFERALLGHKSGTIGS